MGNALSGLLRVDDIIQSDIIIAVVGQTGVGKSTFINRAAGDDILPVNHGLTPLPSEVRHVECRDPERYGNRRVVFVDTPAFDSERDEKEVERKLKRWLKKFFSRKARISGILYLHRITDTKLTDPPGPRLTLLESLCRGSVGGFPRRVMMVTTMWGNLQSPQVGQEREAELQKLWDRQVPRGDAPSEVQRFDDTPESAWSTVFALLGEVSQAEGARN